MTLQEAQSILLEMKKPNPKYGEDESKMFDFVLEADKKYFRDIYYHIFNLCNNKTPVKHIRTLNALKRNPLVTRITRTTKGYEIATAYGTAEFWNSKKSFKARKYPAYITLGKDFDNALMNVVDFHQNSPSSNPEVMVGLFHYPLEPEKAYPTAYATYEVPKCGRYVLDVKLNMCMEEGLFKRLTGFKELERINGEWACNLFDITADFTEHPSYDDNNEPSFGHAVLAPKEYFKYVSEVLNGDRPNNFPFGLVTNNPTLCSDGDSKKKHTGSSVE